MQAKNSPEQKDVDTREPTVEDVDLRSEVPDLEPYIPPSKRVINVEHPEIRQPTNRISVIKALHQITNSQNSREVGENGPIKASVSTDANQGLETLRLYEVMFGRDSLRVSLDLLDRYPNLAHETIVALAELQGVKLNPRSGEEPGRIIHEKRDPATDEIARKISTERGWEWPYYESIDATPMFITAIKRYCKQEGSDLLSERYPGKDGTEHTVADYFQASVGWLVGRLEQSPRGLLESHRKMGIESESWKDSWDAFSHHKGDVANLEQDIAPVDVQVLAYDALIDAAIVCEKRLGQAEQGQLLREKAGVLRDKIMNWFWVNDPEHDGGYFCIGLDYDKSGKSTQLGVRASDMGHLLNSRLLDGDDPEIVSRRESIIKNLFSPDMLSASGIRTLARDEKRFIPTGYHTGSVWLWDTYYIAQGLERQGYYGLSEELKKRIWLVTDTTNLLPEFARGGDEPLPELNKRIVDIWDSEGLDTKWDGQTVSTVKGRTNRIEQPPQEIQAWTVAAILASKYKRDPLHPERAVPTQAVDPVKRAFEDKILHQLLSKRKEGVNK